MLALALPGNARDRKMKWIRTGLQIIGAASLVLFVAGAWLLYRDMTEHVNAAGEGDAVTILKRSDIGSKQNIMVIGSYRSERSFTGDHLDAYCIQLSRFELANDTAKYWHEGPETNPILFDAFQTVAHDAHAHASCFPTFEQANSKGIMLRFLSAYINDGMATAAEILMYEPKTKKLYYVSFKT